jgi:glucose/mannose-6-phosphate isomerase
LSDSSRMTDPLADVRSVDAEGQLDAMLALGDHLRDALWRVESAKLEASKSAGLFACGMGGSAIGADLARAAIGPRLTSPISTVRGYALPPYASAERAALCSSYSGETEETMACFEAAGEIGSRRIVATTGGALEEAARAAEVPVIGLPSGVQPRAAVGHMFGVACEVAAACGAAPSIRDEIEGAAGHVEARRDELAERSAEIAARLGLGTTVVYGCGLTAPAAYRWKTQINENAKLPAFFNVLPEADHNELAAWVGADESSELAAVFLLASDQTDRERQRIQLTAKLVGEQARAVELVEAEGESPSARLLEAVLLGDLVSLQLAAKRGIDPSPVEAIERLKDELGRP